MIQFTQKDIDVMKQKLIKDNSIIEWLIKENTDVIENDIIVQKTGLATWTHYYYCPYHSVKLQFNARNSKEHICSVDGQIFTGEPYDGAWWRIMNGLNAQACHHLSLLWVFTGDEKYFNKAKSIMLEYAKYYRNYEVHGGIPHNGPGKANCQTLCEANWIRSIALGYDAISGKLSFEEKRNIEDNLLMPCAEFLKEHRTKQIHNHEVIISASIGILGIILNREDLIHFGVYEKYGLIYQLENAVLNDYFWFEGTVNYHCYALEILLWYEKFARYTGFSNLTHPNYKEMLKMPIRLMQPDFTFPLLNDTLYNHVESKIPGLYEFAYRFYGDKEFLWMLNKNYKNTLRNNLDSFIYGVECLPQAEEMEFNNYHNADGSGLTVLRGKNDRYLLIKHSPFGGEHDHYDRLGISFLAYGNKIAHDLGTTGYGAKMHYDYYKNTGSHNTVVINEENQPPANARVLSYKETKDYIFLDTEVKWDGSYVTLESHTRVEWDVDSYKDVSMRRIIIWCGDYFIEVFKVDGVSSKSIDWVLHVCGCMEPHSRALKSGDVLSNKKPFRYIKDITYINNPGKTISTWNLGDTRLNLYSFNPDSNTVYFGQGPDNPSISDISYIINRVTGNGTIYLNVFEAYKKGKQVVKDVEFSVLDKEVSIVIVKESEKLSYRIDTSEGYLK